jgi:hypothetical protein
MQSVLTGVRSVNRLRKNDERREARGPMQRFLFLVVAILFLPTVVLGQKPVKAQQPPRAKGLLEITLEQKIGEETKPVAAEHVFEQGDVVRFKLHSDYNGYLYVMNQSTSGEFSTVFPAADTGSDNRIAAKRDYVVPADGWFRISGPAGFEVLYFLLSPTALTQPAVAGRPGGAGFVMPGPASSLKPRCNDEVFRARGECMDTSAGPSAVPPGAALPPEISPIAGSASRDITFTRNSDSTTVGTNAGKAPVIYTFRLAHN